MRPRIVVREWYPSPGQPGLSFLLREEFDVISCDDGQTVLEEVAQRPPEAVVYVLRPESAQDLGALQLLRHMSPHVTLVLIATEASPGARRLVEAVYPIYYAVFPIDAAELRNAVTEALAQRSIAAPGEFLEAS